MALIAIFFVSASAYFINLGSSSLWDSNEAFYAETPRRMLETGDWINPSFNGRPRFNKPPLSYWIVAASYKAFGVSEWAERLPIAFGAMAMMIAAFALGRTIFRSNEAGLFAAIALAANPRFLIFSRRIIIDVYLSAFMGVALLAFALSESPSQTARRKKLLLALMYASIGLGVMTKGPVAAVLPGMAFLTYLIINSQIGRLKEMMLPTGALIVAAIVVPWYAAVYAQHGWHYIGSFIMGDNVSRYLEPTWGPRRGPFFYIPVLMGDMFPWSIFLIVAMALALCGKFAPDGSKLLLVWIAVIVLFFSISRNKQDLYIAPAYTAAAALVGGFIVRARQSVLLGWAALAVGALLSIAGAALILAARRYELAGSSAIGLTALSGGLLASAVALRRRIEAALVIAIAVASANLILVAKTLPDFERYKPVRAFSQIIKSRAGPGALVGYYRLASPSMVFYLGRPVFEYYDQKELEAAFASGAEVYCIMTAADYEAIRPSLPCQTHVLASRPMFQVKLNGILKGAALPRAVLVSNSEGAEGS
jgi:4-amino-4-deoxy-L-arabinose transferase-like glycosyltransferase